MTSIVSVMKKVAEQEVERILTTELGIVTAVFPHTKEDDKDNYQCTVKLKTYHLPDGSDFELRKVPICTPHMGLACIPNLDDLVLVNFIGGDINAPVVVGRLYNDADRPPPNQEKEFLLQHNVLEGGSLKIDETGSVTITSKDEQNVVTINDKQISAVNEKYQIVIDVEGEKISITADKDIEIKSSDGVLSLDAKEVKINGQEKVEINGQEVEISSQADCSIEAGGNANISGSKVDIK